MNWLPSSSRAHYLTLAHLRDFQTAIVHLLDLHHSSFNLCIMVRTDGEHIADAETYREKTAASGVDRQGPGIKTNLGPVSFFLVPQTGLEPANSRPTGLPGLTSSTSSTSLSPYRLPHTSEPSPETPIPSPHQPTAPAGVSLLSLVFFSEPSSTYMACTTPTLTSL